MPVVDATVLVAATADLGARGDWAETTLSGYLAAPQIVYAEAANALRRLEGKGTLTPSEATAAHRGLFRVPLMLFPFEPLAERVWELRPNLTCYDAWYVALAEALEYPLATIDRRLARAPGPTCEFLIAE